MLRFQSQIQVSALSDEQIDNQFEVIMPRLDLYGNNWPADASSNKSIIGSILSGIKGTVTSYTPIVEEIVFGLRNFKTQTRRVRTGWANVAEDIENYHDVSITMFCSSGMLVQQYLTAWKGLIFNTDGEYYNPMSVYKKNIEVYFYGPGNIGVSGLAAAHFTLIGCFPYAQDDYQLKYTSDPKRLRITQKFKCDKVITDATTLTRSITAELLTSPTSIVDSAISQLTSMAMSDAGYTTIDTYK